MILLIHKNKPNLVKNSLRSILSCNKYYQNWQLAIISKDEISTKIQHKIYTDTKKAVIDSSADIVIILEEGNELYPSYLHNLNLFFVEHKNILYCISNIHEYNPVLEKTQDVNNIIYPEKLDIAQLAWRIKCNKLYGAWTIKSLQERCGTPQQTGFISQYKSIAKEDKKVVYL